MTKVQVRQSPRTSLEDIGFEITSNTIHVRTSLAELGKSINRELEAKARTLAGIKGYVSAP